MWECYVWCVDVQWYEVVVEVVEECGNDYEEYYQDVVVGDQYVLEVVVWGVFVCCCGGQMCVFEVYVLYVWFYQFYLYVDGEGD